MDYRKNELEGHDDRLYRLIREYIDKHRSLDDIKRDRIHKELDKLMREYKDKHRSLEEIKWDEISKELNRADKNQTEELHGRVCFVATAAYGSDSAPEVFLLRRFRDRVFVGNRLGGLVVSAYYVIGPRLARVVQNSNVLRSLVKWLVLEPVVWAVRMWVQRR